MLCRDRKSVFILLCATAAILCAGCAPQPPREKVYLTLEQLEYFDGKEGRPTYVAVNGDIYDISKCWYWKHGEHAAAGDQIKGGRDLTDALSKSKHGIKHVKRYPLVGHVIETEG